jgi:DNA-binding transcriptional LysR family regulator
MELRHLRYFLSVADCEGFSPAARKLHVSQSAISEQIRNLEEEIGVPLIDRNQRHLKLTPHGEIFLEEARNVLSAADHAVEMAQRSARGETGNLAIGFFVWGVGAFFPKLIREYRRRYPGVRLSLFEMTAAAQNEAFASGRIDIGFTRPLEPPFSETLESELLYRDPIVAVLPRTHPLAKGSIRVEALAGERFVLCDRASSPTLFDSIIALCRNAGFSPRPGALRPAPHDAHTTRLRDAQTQHRYRRPGHRLATGSRARHPESLPRSGARTQD